MMKMVCKYCCRAFVMALAVTALFGCEKQPPIDNVVRIHSIYELNQADEGLDSHAGEESYSVLEADYNYQTLIANADLKVDRPYYPRIKKTGDGHYIIFYQNASISSTIYYSLSSDLVNWSTPEILFQPVSITSSVGPDSRRYHSCDAHLLSNGDLLAVVSYRANKGYRYDPSSNGIMARRSRDNGSSWGEEETVYVGTNWEPYLYELPSGELQCYFTDTDPSYSPEGVAYDNSGTSYVSSTDFGKTWTPTGVSQCYKVIRQYKYDIAGVPIFTDQMPSVIMLNDGKTLAGFMEARMESGPGASSTYFMSLVYAQNQWKSLSGREVGPEDRQTNIFSGAGGYIRQFRSGETVITCNLQSKFSAKIGDCRARTFNGRTWNTDWYQPFGNGGYWGNCDIAGTHEILFADNPTSGFKLGLFYLNHRINAYSDKITVDGKNGDWKHDQALFIGSASEAQTSFRAACRNGNLYILVERYDRYLNTGDNTTIYLHDGGEENSSALNGYSAMLEIYPEGLNSSYRYDGEDWQQKSITGLEVVGTIVGELDDSRSDTGYLTEICIPLTEIGVTGKFIRINAVTKDGGVSDTFTSATINKPTSWMMIKIAE